MSARDSTDAPRERRPRRGSDLGARILVAIPAIAFACLIVALGRGWFAAGVGVLGLVAMRELYTLMRPARPVDIAGYMALIAIAALAATADREDVLVALVAAFPVIFVFILLRPDLEHASWGTAATLLGIVWIGLPIAHAIFLRDLDHGGGLVIDVLIGTFVADTAAYLGGRMWGRIPLAPEISPNKTVEGLLAGVVVGTFAFWFAGLYQDWFGGLDALIIGLLVAVTAPIGDLFESAIKRDLEVKDTGRVFGAHGGALDRLDAVLFTVVVAYYASVGLGYG